MIIDTSILVDIDRGKNLERLEKINIRNPKISAATYMEMVTGLQRNKNFSNKTQIQQNLQIIPISDSIAEKAGEILANLLEKGNRIGINDIYIGATALVEKEPVLTKDIEDFRKIDRLQTINWNRL